MLIQGREHGSLSRFGRWFQTTHVLAVHSPRAGLFAAPQRKWPGYFRVIEIAEWKNVRPQIQSRSPLVFFVDGAGRKMLETFLFHAFAEVLVFLVRIIGEAYRLD